MNDYGKRGGYPGSGDGATMGPPSPLPSGYFEAVPVPPDGYVPGEFIDGPPLEALSQAKVFALEQAVDCCRWFDLYQENDPAARIVGVARKFEAYLTAPPSKED